MRYEFERDGTVVASVLWEGPGQVSVDAIDNSTRATVDRYLSSEVVYLGGGFDVRRRAGARRAADAPARLDAVGVRAGVPQPGPPAAGAGAPRRDRARGGARGGRGMTFKGADAVSRPSSRRASRSSSASRAARACRSTTRSWIARRSGTSCAATSRAPATRRRATRGRPARSACAWRRAVPARRTSSPPLADAKMDSVPIVAITGQVPTPVVGNDAFQEADITGITMPVTKHNFLVKDAADIVETIREAFHIARSGRPGPGAGRHSQGRAERRDQYTWPEKINLPGYKPTTKGNNRQVSEAVKLILAAERPVLYVGGGVIKANASEELMQLGDDRQAPGRHHADGARRLPRLPRAVPGHAGHARELHGGHRDAARRPARRARRRASTTASRASCPRSRRTPRSSTSTSIRPRSARTAFVDVPIVGDCKDVIAKLAVELGKPTGGARSARSVGVARAARRLAASATRYATARNPTAR